MAKLKKIGLLLTLILSFVIADKASAATTTIRNPSVFYSRWYTTRATVPTISSDTVEIKQIPYDILISTDAFLIGNDNWFRIENNNVLELTTFSGDFSYEYGAPQGGPITNCHITLRLSTGSAVNPDCIIDENNLGPTGGGVRYKFSGSIPTNTSIVRVDFNVGDLNCTDAYSCTLPLSSGKVSLTSFNMVINSQNSAGTTQIIERIDSVSSELTVISDKLDTIISLLENMDGLSSEDMEEALENARESEKEEYEEQAQETEDTANDESSAAQGSATSLLSVVGQFIGVLTSAQPTNCNLNGNLIPHLPLGQLNLCQNSPPAAITILGSLLLIAFVVPLAYHTVKRMLALIGSFQS